ncbi:hypothetical protein GCM10011274_01550 [Paraglaciecola chathamensis]|uniref:Uncharacterized protein n=1 Tax=Paraglaciecola chathamensis TaxID=368405 RepID=A0A8H9ICA7_9ALTE|nr:hypothetical protein GCM10011274_01550 [Paraglaciecola oceanifecundans]
MLLLSLQGQASAQKTPKHRGINMPKIFNAFFEPANKINGLDVFGMKNELCCKKIRHRFSMLWGEVDLPLE